MTTQTMTTTAAGRPPRGGLYGRLWRGVPRELGFLLPTLLIVVVSMSVLWSLFSAGLGMVTILVGFFVLVGALFVARGFGVFELKRLRAAGFPEIAEPDWTWPDSGGFISRVFGIFANGHYWLALVHGLFVNIFVGTITWSISFTWLVTGIAGSTYWIYSGWIPRGDDNHGLFELIQMWLAPNQPVIDSLAADNLFNLAIGLIFLATLPFVTHGLTWIHYAIARGMLGAFRSDELRRQVIDLSASRGAAIATEGHSLRRLERDIHDGPQQRLVRLQMDLAAADRHLDNDPAQAKALIAEAMAQSREALDELRALSRGFAPPLLLDRGLVPALESAAARSTIPAQVIASLPADIELSTDIERNAYFIASEALANAAKHSGATEVLVRIWLGESAGRRWLTLGVADNGRGGAVSTPGHGLAGLEERLRGLGGTLNVVSPAGGPTVVTAALPL